MTDRVPGAPGQYKAILTEDNLEKMQSGEEFSITMVRDDCPIVEGTPYSKAAVLPDDLAQSLCPNIVDPTPADAFNALHQKSIESSEHPGCYYRMVDSEQEWINPPMVIDTEYRTTERYLGKPVFARILGFGELPNNTYKSFPIEDFGAETFIFAQGVTSDGQLFPFASITLGNTNISGIDMYVTRDVIAVRTYINRSHQTAEIKIKYTKA